MYISIRNSIGLLILLAAAVATWLASRHEISPGADADTARSTPLGYYLRDAVFLGTDENGRVFYRVHAGLAERQADDQGLALQRVRVEYRDTEHVQWQLSADRAATRAVGDFLDLSGDVRLSSTPTDDRMPTVIETDALRLEPDRFLASSDSPVRVSIGDASLRATGLKAHLKDDKLELESNVHGQFLR